MCSKTIAQFIFFIFFHLSIVGCDYNPLGGSHSHIDDSKNKPNSFSFKTIITLDNKVHLTWATSEKANSYNVIYGQSSGNYTKKVSNCINIAQTFCTISNLNTGTTYYFNVEAKNTFGSKNTTKEMSVTPKGFSSFISTSSGEVLLSWKDVCEGINCANYTLQYGTSPNSISQSISNVKSPYLLTGLANGNNYYFQIVASNIIGTAYSPIISALVINPPSTPTWVGLPSVTSREINFNWNAAVGAGTIRYTLYRSTMTGKAYSAVRGCIDLKALTCNDDATSLIPGNIYYYIIIATSEGGSSANSSEVNVVTFPVAPNGLSVTSPTTSSSLLTWATSPGNADITYNIYRSLSSPVGITPVNKIGSVNSTFSNPNLSFVDNGPFIDNNIYYYALTATNISGNSEKSSDQSIVSSLLTAPFGLSASFVSSSSLNLGWNLGVGNAPIMFNVFRSLVNNPTNWGMPVYTGGVTSFADSGLTENTNYYYMVNALNSRSNAIPQQSTIYATITALKTPPSFNPATNITNNSITLNWNKVPNNGDVTYQLFRSTTGLAGSWGSAIFTTTSATTYADTGLLENKNYYYMLSAINGAIGAAAINSNIFNVTTAIQTIPTFIIPATNVTSNSLTLNWNALPNDGTIIYSLFRSTSGLAGNWGNPIYVGSLTSFNDNNSGNGLIENTNYYYMISAVNAASSSVLYSANYQVTTGLQTIPTFSAATNVSSSSITLNWNGPPNNGAVTYRLYRSLTGVAGSWNGPINSPSSATTFADSGLSENTNYYYMVSATNTSPGAMTLNSSSYIVSTDLQTIPTFSGATNVSSSSITLNWNGPPNNGAVTYQLYRSLTGVAGSWNGPINSPSSATTFTDSTGLNENTNYYYMVTAINTAPGGTAKSSAASSVTTALATASTLSVFSISTGSVSLKWTAANGTGSVSYNLYRSTSLPVNTSGSAICANISITSCNDNTVNASSTYYYVVTTTNNQNTVSSSPPISVTTLPNAPTAPTVTATDGNVVITWPQSPSAGTPSLLSYLVQRSRLAGSGYQDVSGCTNIPDSNRTCNDVVPTVDGSPYYYRVIALTAGGSSPVASPATAVTPITPISSINVVASTTNINLSWSGAVGANIYNVYSSTVIGGSAPENGGTLTGCTSSPCNFAVGTVGQTIYYTIVASNTAANSSASVESSEVSATSLNSPLIQVVAMTSQVTVNWGTVANATNFKIYYSTTSRHAVSDNILGCNAGLATSCTISGLNNGQVYYFALFVTRSVGGNFQSSEVTGTPIGNFSITSVTPTLNTATVIWTSAAGATSYDVSYGTVSRTYTNTINIAAVGGATQSSTLISLMPGTQYYFMVKAKNANGGVNANAESTTVTSPIPPVNVTFLGVSNNSATIQWDNNTLNVPITYKVYRSTQSSFNITDAGVVFACWNYSNLATPTQLSCLDNTTPMITENTKYYYKIVSVTDAVGGIASQSSNPSNTVSITSQFNPTDSFNLSVSNLTATSLTLSWTFNAGSENITYAVYQSTSANAATTGAIINCSPSISSTLPGTTNTCNVTGLTQNKNYYFQVKATNNAPAGSTSIVSNELPVITPIATGTSFTLASSNITDTSVTLNWTFNNGSSNINYTILQGGVAVLASQISTCNLSNLTPSAIQVSCNVTGLTQNTAYTFTVQATNAATGGGSTITSSSTSIITKFTALSTFNLTAGAVTDTSATLNWIMNLGNSTVSYTILQAGNAVLAAQVSGCILTNLTSSATQVSCNVTGLSQNTDYSFSIKATNNSTGGSTYITSNNLSITTKFTTGTSFTLSSTSITATNITLNWTMNTGNSNVNYTIWQNGIQITTVCSLSGISPSSTAITCGVTGLSENTVYSYLVQATNNATGGSSTISSATLSVTPPPQTAPSGLKATITNSTTVSLSWNAFSLGNVAVTYTIYASTSSIVSLTPTNIYCNNISITSCSNTQVNGTNFSNGTTYYFVIVAMNSSGTSVASTPSLAMLFQSPTNTASPVIAGEAASGSGIVSGAGVTLTGAIGTWSDTNSCTYQWYSNTIPISGATGTITAANSPISYVTQVSDVCNIISFSVTCTNALGTKTIYNSSPNNSIGINTSAILTDYAVRVPAATSAGKTLIQNFLDQLISNNLPLPNVVYPMLASQNAGSGTTLFDLYCNTHNANMGSALPWDNVGGITPAANGLSTVSNIFTGNTSTIIAYNRSPVINANSRGVAGYTNGSASLNSFGYGSNTSSLIFETLPSTSSTMLVPLSQGRYDFWGVSMNGTSVTMQQNEFQHPDTANSVKNGGLVLGSLDGSSNTGLQDYLSFASAWTSSAFSFLQLETVRRITQATVVSNVQIFPPYFYVGNSNSIQNVTKCAVNQTNGTLGSCVLTGFGFGNPTGTARYNNYVYVANALVAGTVDRCAINSADGTLGSCTSVIATLLGVYGLTVSKGLNGAYLYTANATTVQVCPINTTNGSISSCSATGSGPGFIGASGLTFSYMNSNPYVYISNRSANQIQKCNVNLSNGTLSSCVVTGSSFNGPTGISINNGYAYISNTGDSSVTKCTVSSSDGSFSSCATAANNTMTGLTQFNNTAGVSVINNSLYIANWGNSTIIKCSISITDGSLSNCATTGSAFNGPIGIAW